MQAMDGFKDRVDGILDVFEGGQAAGTGAAQILFGDYSPSGMMPFTTYPADFVTKVKMSDMSMYVAFVSASTFRLGCAFLLPQG